MENEINDIGLTDKQEAFCNAYVQHWNATKAAKEAGYSEKTAYSSGQRLLKDVEIRARINELKKDIEYFSLVSKLRNIQELAKVAYFNIGDSHTTDFSLKDFESLPESVKSCIQEVNRDERIIGGENPVKVTTVKVKFYNKIQAIQEISKLMGYYEPDKVEHSGEVGKSKWEDMSMEELEYHLAELEGRRHAG